MGDKYINIDAQESVFFDRELEYIKSQSYDVKFPQLKAKTLIPVSTEAGPGASTITYRAYEGYGVAKIIASYADDLPRADVGGKEFTSNVRSLGDSYGYNVQEIREWGERASQVTTCDKDFWTLVEEANLGWIYIRKGTGGLQPENLENCNGILETYTNNSVWIFTIQNETQ